MRIGGFFNHEIKPNVLPINLHTLIFEGDFNQDIKENVLPINLHSLWIGNKFNNNIKIPMSVRYISLYSHNNLINNLPYHIETVFIKFEYSIEHNIINLPYTIKKIIIGQKKDANYIKIPFDCILEILNKL